MNEMIKKLQHMLNNDGVVEKILDKVRKDTIKDETCGNYIDYEEIAVLLSEHGFTEDRTDIDKYDIIKCIGEIVESL